MPELEDSSSNIKEFSQFVNIDKNENKRERQYFSERFSNEIIERAPDKMMDIVEDYVVIVSRNLILYFDVKKHLEAQVPSQPDEKLILVREEDVLSIKIKPDKKFICLQEIGHEQSCIVVEDTITREISFLKFELNESNQINRRKRMRLIGLSIKENQTESIMARNTERSPLLKFRSSATIDPDSHKWAHVGLALRENGCVEFYSEFIYVDQLNEAAHECVDVEVGHNNFYFKFVKN